MCSKTGAMMGVGVHGVAIIRALCGDEPTVVNATALWAVEHQGGGEPTVGATTVLLPVTWNFTIIYTPGSKENPLPKLRV